MKLTPDAHRASPALAPLRAATLALTLALAASSAQVAPAEESDAAEETGFKHIELLTEVMETIRQGYVDPDKVTYERLINSALAGMLADLDPHSQFMQPKVFEQLQQNTDSTYEGIGVTISTKNDMLLVVTAREDGPAARAGILPGDQILKINDQLTEDIGITQAVNLLRGRPGEPLKLTVRRPATQQLHEFEMKREVIRQDSVTDIRVLDPELTAPYRMGYARILQFSEPTAEEFADALDELEQEGIDAFVLDLRNNPGGLLGSAVDVAGEFVKAGTVVLTTEGKPGSGEIRVYRTSAEKKRRDRDYPLAILVNHSSASGSEVVSGALQDLKRCIVVGETTFGKGSVQSIIPIGEGKAIRMTTAKYYTPSHRTIHENGVVPNIVAPLTPAQEQGLMRWFARETLEPEERKKAESFRDPQLVRAVDAMKGALVYGALRGGEGALAAAGAASGEEAKVDADADAEVAESTVEPAKPAPEPAESGDESERVAPPEVPAAGAAPEEAPEDAPEEPGAGDAPASAPEDENP